MSSNLFQVSGATAVFDSTDLKFPQDVNAATALTFNVSFSPGVDSLGMPTIAEDSIKNRDTVLTQLSGMGVSILCNPIYAAEPLNGGSAGKNGAQPSTPDSVGCGDGVASTPNVWFMQIQKTDANAALFKDVALMASNLFIVRNIVAANSATKSGTQTFPVNVAETSALNFEVAFIQGNDSIAMPTMAKDSVANRDATLLQLAGDHVEIDCDEIGVGGPLGG